MFFIYELNCPLSVEQFFSQCVISSARVDLKLAYIDTQLILFFSINVFVEKLLLAYGKPRHKVTSSVDTCGRGH